MGAIASQITSLTIVYSTVYSGADQRKHQSSGALAFVRGIHRGPVNSLHKWPVTQKMFPFDDFIIISMKTPSYQYRNFHGKDEMASHQFYLDKRNPNNQKEDLNINKVIFLTFCVITKRCFHQICIASTSCKWDSWPIFGGMDVWEWHLGWNINSLPPGDFMELTAVSNAVSKCQATNDYWKLGMDQSGREFTNGFVKITFQI